MVKLFVGNLADTVDSTKLKQVFQQFTKVTECDVVKNYAFVHIEDDDVQSIINRLNGYTLEGKNIHIQLSTSKLRSQPGMSNQCFRCASTDHKTPNCPKDPNNQVTQTIKIDLTGAVKRPAGAMDGPDAKRPLQMISMVDEEIPRPPEPELQQLYEEYNLSRQRYTYYRERLQKEIHAKRNGMAGSVYVTPFAPTLGAATTQLSSAAVPYIAPQPQAYTQPAAIGGSHPYSLKAPYAAATPPQVPQVAGVPQLGTIPGQQTTYLTNQPTAMYGTVTATMQPGMVNMQPQQGLPYVTAVQQQQPTIGVQSSAPMTTQQYLQSVGLQQTQQQQQTQLGLGQPQQTTLNAPYTGLNATSAWMQQQQQQQQQQPQSVQQQMLGQYQRQGTYQSPQQPQQQQSYQGEAAMLARAHAVKQCLRCCGMSCRAYRAGANEFGHLPDPPKSVFTPEGDVDIAGKMRPEDSQRVHLINAFRRYGYLQAELDPLGLQLRKEVPELSPAVYGLSPNEALPVGKELNLEDLAEQLRLIYCGPMAIEFMHINNWEERQWLAQHFENTITEELLVEERVKLAKLMIKCENFDHFLALKFPTVKRYGSEGAEAMYGFFSELFDAAPEKDIKQIFIGIAHRGRLNLLTEMMQFPAVQMFRKMKGKPEFPDGVQGSGDVLSHFTSSFDHQTPEGTVHISMLPNPSHLEAVNPVTMGKARARARSLGVGDYSKDRAARTGDGVLAVLVHGDGAFTGQGIVWESISLSQAPHFRLGGSIHLITNNQVAFTAEAHIGRSTTHCTDIAKAFECPVIHVNGDHAEDVVKATRLAMNYREKFRKDIFINMMCYRRWGHNELDDPSFTQPIMYRVIENRDSVPRQYVDELIDQGLLTEEDVKKETEAHTAKLMESFKAIDSTPPVAKHLEGNWKGFVQAPPEVQKWDTGCDPDLLRYIGAASVKVPDGFNVHPHLQKTHCDARIQKMTTGQGIDWGTAESLAFGLLLLEGNDVRISGQDVGRATFSFRHAMLVDYETDLTHIPLNFIVEDQKGYLEVANNILSEEAILGFEFGYSLDNPRRLCVWEAQFGDFFNGAQIIIDTFLASAESKWLTQSGLTLLLPHGIDGAGPEHSTCRMERFLQLCNSREDQVPVDGENVNLRIANPTTSAQYFHLLRRQVIPNYRKPLVVVAPKILLRHPKAASSLSEFAPGTYFKNVIDDNTCKPEKVTKVILTSGKHWIAVEKARDERGLKDSVAIVRLESLCPFPVQDLRETLQRYPKAKKFVWSQEEARNAGAWSFVRPRFENALGISPVFAGRPELAWTATAIGEHHAKEAEEVIKKTFEA